MRQNNTYFLEGMKVNAPLTRFFAVILGTSMNTNIKQAEERNGTNLSVHLRLSTYLSLQNFGLAILFFLTWLQSFIRT